MKKSTKLPLQGVFELAHQRTLPLNAF